MEPSAMMALRDYQERAVVALLRSHRGIVQIPAGGGKSLVMACALSWWLEDVGKQEDGSVWWLANTIEQIEQAKAACAHFSIISELCPGLRFSCYAALPDCSGALLVIGDEIHHIASPEYRKALNGCMGRIWGCSATPHRADELAQDVFKLAGPIVCKVDRSELLADGHLAQARVIFHAPNLPNEFVGRIAAVAEPLIQQRKRFWHNVSEEDIRKRTLWATCQEFGLFKNFKRNSAIVRLANEHLEDSTIVLVGSIEHGQLLAQGIPGAVVVFSKLGAKRRRAAMEAFRAGELRCMIATSLADEGMDLPRASVMIMAVGGRSSAKAEQRTGRVLRAWGEKTHGTIHDFWDSSHYFLLAQSKARLRLYRGLGYKIEGTGPNALPRGANYTNSDGT